MQQVRPPTPTRGQMKKIRFGVIFATSLGILVKHVGRFMESQQIGNPKTKETKKLIIANTIEMPSLSRTQMEQLLKLLNFNPSTTAPVGSLAQIGSVFSSPPWIIDSGASDHMTNLSKLFQTYVPCPGNQKIRIADGSFSPIAGKGSVPISKNITLKSVLHVPKLACNLLSVSKLCQDSNYCLIFLILTVRSWT